MYNFIAYCLITLFCARFIHFLHTQHIISLAGAFFVGFSKGVYTNIVAHALLTLFSIILIFLITSPIYLTMMFNNGKTEIKMLINVVVTFTLLIFVGYFPSFLVNFKSDSQYKILQIIDVACFILSIVVILLCVLLSELIYAIRALLNIIIKN